MTKFKFYYSTFINLYINTVTYTANGTDPNEIHLVGSGLNFKYFKDVDLLQNNNGLIEYDELDVTKWLWPNYIKELQDCPPELPTFYLQDEYSIELSEINQENYTYLAFDHWRNSKFLFRICTNVPSTELSWETPSWTLYNETTGSFRINTSKITSVGVFKLIFQSQLIGNTAWNYSENNYL